MEKRSAFLTNVDERCLHPRKDAGHLAEHDVPDSAPVSLAFDVEFRDDAALNQGYSGLSQVDVYDNDVTGHALAPGRRSGRLNRLP